MNKICPICKSSNCQRLKQVKGYLLLRCNLCQLVWDPNPSELLLNQYNENYFKNDDPKGGYANYFEGMKINKRTFHERLYRIKKLIGNKGKILDVGCALGDCLVEAVKLGWRNPVGIEVSEFAFRQAKKRKLNVINSKLTYKLFKPNTFDAILYQDVIEHVENPLQELKKVFMCLKANGVIFLITPNIGGLWSRLLGRNWYHYKKGEHVVYFSPVSMKMVLEKAGFVDIKIQRTYHVLSIGYILNRLSYYSSIFKLFFNISNMLGISEISFRSYIGELEAWGRKK